MSPSTKRDHLLVFGRYPRPGKTKTRLIPVLGPAGAAHLQRKLAERTVTAARRCVRRTAARLVFHHDGGSKQQMIQWLGRPDIDYVPQAGGDLGHRMFVAIEAAFDRGARRVILVGTDIPEISRAVLEQAFRRLHSSDLVLGPSTDGGYWLVGMNRPANLFTQIPWSTPAVLDRTLALAKRENMPVRLLEPLVDLDEPADLERIGYGTAPYLSVVIPTVNEERHLPATLAGAVCADAEMIVSDGGSTDRTVARARACGARIVKGPRGRAGQQNRGAAAARGDVLLFLHADTRLPNGYVDHIFEILMNRRVVLGAFRFQTDLVTPAMRWITFWTNLRASLLQLPYGDQGLFLPRRVFEAVGGFPQTPIAEDLYLVRRLARHGRIALAPVAAVTSGRRWRQIGSLRTTMINTIIACGCLAGVDPSRLAPLYRLPARNQRT